MRIIQKQDLGMYNKLKNTYIKIKKDDQTCMARRKIHTQSSKMESRYVKYFKKYMC